MTIPDLSENSKTLASVSSVCSVVKPKSAKRHSAAEIPIQLIGEAKRAEKRCNAL